MAKQDTHSRNGETFRAIARQKAVSVSLALLLGDFLRRFLCCLLRYLLWALLCSGLLGGALLGCSTESGGEIVGVLLSGTDSQNRHLSFSVTEVFWSKSPPRFGRGDGKR